MFSKRSFSVRLSLLVVLVICLPLLMVFMQTTTQLRRITLQNNQEMNQNNLESMSNNINVFFDQYCRITDLLFISEDIQLLGSKVPEGRVETYEYNAIFKSAVKGITFNSTELENVYLFTQNGTEYFLESNKNLANARNCCENYLAENPNPSSSIISIRGYFVNGEDSEPQYHVIMLRPLFNYVTRDYLGMIALEFSTRTFSKLLGYTSDITLIVSPENTILYNSAYASAGKDVSDFLGLPDKNSESYERVLLGKKSYAYTQTHTNYDLQIIQLKDMELTNQLVVSAVFPILLVTLLCVSIFVTIAISMAHRMAAPITQLKQTMERVGAGDLSVRANIHTNDEFETLADSYNHMLDQLNQMMQRACSAESLRIDAEYRALQSQINPHFLYNALESINSLAQINRQGEISQMVCSLADMFRYSTHQSQQLVPVRDELEYLRNYLYLQSIGYEDRVHTLYDIPDEVLALRIPKVILQPIVENCFNHAFETASSEFLITIRARLEDEFLVFTVQDNGAGMDGAQLETLRKTLDETKAAQAGTGSIGLGNIHRRLRFMFGDSSGLHIESEPGHGTCVTLRILLGVPPALPPEKE